MKKFLIHAALCLCVVWSPFAEAQVLSTKGALSGQGFGEFHKTVSSGTTPSFRASANAVGSSSTSVTVNKPTGTASGDFLIAVINDYNQQLYNTPTGWTILSTATATAIRVSTFYKIAGGSEPSSYSFTTTGASTLFALGIISSYKNVSTGIDVVSSSMSNNNGGVSTTVSSLTVSHPGKLVLYGGSYSTSPVVTPTGFNSQVQVNTSSDYGYFFDKTSTNGSTGSVTISSSGGVGIDSSFGMVNIY